MSLRNTARALPALLRTGMLDAIAYRAEMLVWILSTTLPLIMLALFTTVAREAPIGRFGEREVTTYFLATFVVRQLTGSWAAWQMNYDLRQGTLSMRLLRPVHPLITYATDALGALPIRALVAVPLAGGALAWVAADALPHTALMWALTATAIVGGWLLTFLVNLAIGCLSFFTESSLKVMDLYFVLFMVMSGYTMPVEMFPPQLRHVVDMLPFRYQVGLPVELLTSAHGPREALSLLGAQWAYVALMFAITAALWKRGIARFEAYGG